MILSRNDDIFGKPTYAMFHKLAYFFEEKKRVQCYITIIMYSSGEVYC